MPFPSDDEATIQAFREPAVGDRFSEIMNFFVYVVHREGDEQIITMEGTGPCTFPDDGEVRVQTLAEFQQRFRYSSSPDEEKYWVRLIGRGHNVDGWV